MSKYEEYKFELTAVTRNREGTAKLLRDLSQMGSDPAYDSLEMCLHTRTNGNNGYKIAMEIFPNRKYRGLTEETREKYLDFLEACHDQFTDRKNFLTQKLEAIETLLNEDEENQP